MKRNPRPAMLASMLVTLAALSASAHAGVVVDGTRFHLSAEESELTVRLMNPDQTSSLVQSWIDDGDANSTPASPSNVPFVIRPPVARVGAGGEQVLRIVSAGQPAAQDREGLYYLNLLDVPATEATTDPQLQLAVRSRFPLYYRPQGLSSAGAADAPKKLKWSLVREAQAWSLRADNPTPYHVSLVSVGSSQPIEGGLITPFASSTYRLSQAEYNALTTDISIEYRTEKGRTATLTSPLHRP
ncbi:fimbrial biogenesis chaperone [Stenotrophomonas maltophilia group sp. P373]